MRMAAKMIKLSVAMKCMLVFLTMEYVCVAFHLSSINRNSHGRNKDICMKWSFSKGKGTMENVGGLGSQGEVSKLRYSTYC